MRLYQQSVRVLTLESAVALSGEFEALLLMDFRGVVFWLFGADCCRRRLEVGCCSLADSRDVYEEDRTMFIRFVEFEGCIFALNSWKISMWIKDHLLNSRIAIWRTVPSLFGTHTDLCTINSFFLYTPVPVNKSYFTWNTITCILVAYSVNIVNVILGTYLHVHLECTW